MKIPVQFTVNGEQHTLDLDPRASVLDTLRDRLGVTSVKKGATTGSAAPARCSQVAGACWRACAWPRPTTAPTS